MENTILDAEEFANEHDYRDYLAPKWKRFINYIIDTTCLTFGFGIVYGIFINNNVSGWESVRVNIYGVLVVKTIYFFCELYTGKTLGKLITGTRVVSVFDEPITANQILIRTLSRIVPFEPFSMLFGYTAWHDDWSDTAVVNKNYQTSY